MPNETYLNVSKEDVGEMVRSLVDENTKSITITPNQDEMTCTVVVEKSGSSHSCDYG